MKTEATKETKMLKKKSTTNEAPRCSECGKEVKSANDLDDCIECGRLKDACNSCVEDHMAEEHPEDED